MKIRHAMIYVLGLSGAVCAQNYPDKSVRVIVPFPPGGGADIVGRAITQKLTDALGKPFLVDNRSGAGGVLGADLAVHAAPDGYTLLFASSSSLSVSPHIMSKPPYDPQRDLTPVILIASSPNVLVVHSSVPARSVKELIALAKARPGEIIFASNGTGSLGHLTTELFMQRAGIKMLHVPYRGGAPATIDTVAGNTSLLFATYSTVSAQVRTGRLRALAVTSARRVQAVPELPTVAEAALPGFESTQWWGIFGPVGLPAEIVGKLNEQINKILGNADIKERLALDATEPLGGTPSDLAKYLKADYDRWGKVVRDAGVRVD
jgi:tripartite-type tricarboxylate transporter receptor subunit TctC